MKYINSGKILKSKQFANWRLGLEVFPQVIEIHPSNVCNNACYYCIAEGKKDGRNLTNDELGKTLDFCKDVGAEAIIFSGGGEPFCNKEFLSNLAYATSALDLEVGIITNGILLNKEMAEAVLSLPKINWIRISFDAITKEQYQQIRGTNTFDIVKQNIKDLLVAKKEIGAETTIGIQMVVNKYNNTTMKDFVDFCLSEFAEIDYIQVRPIETMIGENPYTDEEMNTIKQQLKQINNEKVLVSDKWDLIFGEREFGFNKCHCAPFIGAIDAHGDYYLCCHMVKNPKYKICNVLETAPEDFFDKRKECFKALGNTIGFNPVVCPIACRGQGPNRALQGIIDRERSVLFL